MRDSLNRQTAGYVKVATKDQDPMC